MRTLARYIIVFSLLFYPALLLSQEEESGILKKWNSSTQEEDLKLQELLSQAEELSSTSQDSAIQIGNEARELAASLGDLQGEALALKHVGVAHFYKGQYAECLRSWQSSMSKYEEAGDTEGVGKILGNLGVVYNNQGYDSKALEMYLKSLSIAEEISDTSTIRTAYNNIGLIYSKKKITQDLALENYAKALILSEETNDIEGIGTQSFNIGEIYFGRGQTDMAQEYFLKSKLAFRSIGDANIAPSLIYLGKIYMENGEFDRAIKSQEEAYEISSSAGDKLEMTRSLIALAESYLIMKNFSKAITLFNEAKAISTEIGIRYEEMAAVKGLAMTYEALTDNVTANFYLNEALRINDSIYVERNQEQLNRLRVQSELDVVRQEFEQVKHDLELREVKHRQQNIIMLLLVLGLLSTIIFVALLFRLSKQRQKANLILEEKNSLITGQKKEITDSIRYASRIQNAVLTPVDDINSMLPDHFILYRPRDIVSGDFYWITKVKNRIMCIVADSTGHGVPGAFMSMLGIAFLNEIISRDPDMHANELLNELRDHIILSLRQKGRAGDSQDGMDLAAMIIDPEKNTIEYAGANNPLLLYREGELIEFKPDKMPIGFHARADQSFTNHLIEIKEGDVAYAFSDGFPDQFGGPKGKKFMIKNLKRQLLCLHQKPMLEQKKELEKILDKWMRSIDQIDDILLMGIRF